MALSKGVPVANGRFVEILKNEEQMEHYILEHFENPKKIDSRIWRIHFSSSKKTQMGVLNSFVDKMIVRKKIIASYLPHNLLLARVFKNCNIPYETNPKTDFVKPISKRLPALKSYQKYYNLNPKTSPNTVLDLYTFTDDLNPIVSYSKFKESLCKKQKSSTPNFSAVKKVLDLHDNSIYQVEQLLKDRRNSKFKNVNLDTPTINIRKKNLSNQFQNSIKHKKKLAVRRFGCLPIHKESYNTIRKTLHEENAVSSPVSEQETSSPSNFDDLSPTFLSNKKGVSSFSTVCQLPESDSSINQNESGNSSAWDTDDLLEKLDVIEKNEEHPIQNSNHEESNKKGKATETVENTSIPKADRSKEIGYSEIQSITNSLTECENQLQATSTVSSPLLLANMADGNTRNQVIPDTSNSDNIDCIPASDSSLHPENNKSSKSSVEKSPHNVPIHPKQSPGCAQQNDSLPIVDDAHIVPLSVITSQSSEEISTPSVNNQIPMPTCYILNDILQDHSNISPAGSVATMLVPNTDCSSASPSTNFQRTSNEDFVSKVPDTSQTMISVSSNEPQSQSNISSISFNSKNKTKVQNKLVSDSDSSSTPIARRLRSSHTAVKVGSQHPITESKVSQIKKSSFNKLSESSSLWRLKSNNRTDSVLNVINMCKSHNNKTLKKTTQKKIMRDIVPKRTSQKKTFNGVIRNVSPKEDLKVAQNETEITMLANELLTGSELDILIDAEANCTPTKTEVNVLCVQNTPIKKRHSSYRDPTRRNRVVRKLFIESNLCCDEISEQDKTEVEISDVESYKNVDFQDIDLPIQDMQSLNLHSEQKVQLTSQCGNIQNSQRNTFMRTSSGDEKPSPSIFSNVNSQSTQSTLISNTSVIDVKPTSAITTGVESPGTQRNIVSRTNTIDIKPSLSTLSSNSSQCSQRSMILETGNRSAPNVRDNLFKSLVSCSNHKNKVQNVKGAKYSNETNDFSGTNIANERWLNVCETVIRLGSTTIETSDKDSDYSPPKKERMKRTRTRGKLDLIRCQFPATGGDSSDDSEMSLIERGSRNRQFTKPDIIPELRPSSDETAIETLVHQVQNNTEVSICGQRSQEVNGQRKSNSKDTNSKIKVLPVSKISSTGKQKSSANGGDGEPHVLARNRFGYFSEDEMQTDDLNLSNSSDSDTSVYSKEIFELITRVESMKSSNKSYNDSLNTDSVLLSQTGPEEIINAQMNVDSCQDSMWNSFPDFSQSTAINSDDNMEKTHKNLRRLKNEDSDNF